MAHSRMVTSFHARRFDYAGGFSTLDGTIRSGVETGEGGGNGEEQTQSRRGRLIRRRIQATYHPLRIATNARVSIRREISKRNASW